MTPTPQGLLIEKPRISSIDIMRGIVMVIMALDHVRHYFHADATLFEPTDLDKTTPLLFFTRWITHFCAPTFVFLSGTAIRISQQRKTKKELAIFLLTRGLWLILLEVTIIRFGFVFNVYYDFNMFQVIWAIGASMVVLSALIFLPTPLISVIGLLIIFGHNLFDSFQLQAGDSNYVLWAFLGQSGFISLNENSFILVPYPVLPWMGLMFAGYGLGRIYYKDFDERKRRQMLMIIGGATIMLFFIIRGINVYGDPAPWGVQNTFVFTVLSFLNCTKYPISLAYALMTIGPVLICLYFLEKYNSRLFKPFIVFGTVPLFYYILHFYLIHASALLLYILESGKRWSEINFSIQAGFGGIPSGWGYSLSGVYIAWILIVLALYPVCKWYYNYKRQNNHWWLSYM